jgi:hypothetical protein
VSRHATGIEIVTLVACRALHADHPEAACPSHHQRLVRVAVVALEGTIARRVAVHASGVQDYLPRFGKEGDRALLLVRNC